MLFITSKKKKSYSDSELVNGFRENGEYKWFEQLFSRYAHLVFGLCLKYLKNEDESKDAVMQIFEKLMTELKKQEVKNFGTWLYSVSRNHCLMFLRGEKRLQNREGKYMLGKEETFIHEDDDAPLPGNITEKQLYAAIARLKEQQKICIEFFYMENKCYQTISMETGFTYNEVKSHIQNGKRNLKLLLTRNYEKSEAENI